jgi:DNA-directed RNA polymerase specialized sigma24 family protein
LGTYLYSVSRFLWLKELGKRKWLSHNTDDFEEFVDADADIAMISEKNERMVLYRTCFEKISEACRKVLSLFAEGFSIAEITIMLGFSSEQHTKNRRYRCKLSLINVIKAEYGYKTLGYGNDEDN